MSSEVEVLRQRDLPQDFDPMGELVKDLKNPPVKVWKPSVIAAVLGNSQKPEIELNEAQVLLDQVPVYKRSGGGGCVLLSPKGFCYSLRLRKQPELHISDYFGMGTGVLQGLLQENFGIESRQKGISDLCIGEKKILGCSLYMPRECVVYYASVLFEHDMESIKKYLAHPSKEPDYRKGRTHESFLTFLQEHLPKETTLDSFMTQLEERINTNFSSALLP